MEHIISLPKLLLLSPRWYATDHEGTERKRERRRRGRKKPEGQRGGRRRMERCTRGGRERGKKDLLTGHYCAPGTFSRPIIVSDDKSGDNRAS